MALLFYQNINFQAPDYLTKENFEEIKENGISEKTSLPNFLKFHLYNIIALSISIITYFIYSIFTNDFTNALFNLGKIINVFWIPKTLIDTYKYLKFIRKENNYKKRLLMIVYKSSSYVQFSNEYNEEFNKSKFGKWLIKKFKK
mgnify:CR=1 FL=1